MTKINLFRDFTAKHYLLIGFILLINLMQAAFTGLHIDEGYYWIYSKDLAWGYFDHPPMVALLIHLGDLISHSQLGIRLFMVLLTTATSVMIIREIKEKDDIWFLTLFMMSFPLFHTHIGGFLALPDIPLVFFSLLFFLVYKRFLEKEDLPTSILLGFIAAAMIYSKYHAFLILGFTTLSNLKLLKSKYFWLVVALTAILLVPHMLWQVENGFPSFKYHIYSRTKPLQLKYVFNNIISQLIVLGPLTFFLIILGLTRFRVMKSDFRRGIIFNILGFYIFFFIISFKDRIEAHWTVAITPLIMIATYPVISGDPKLKKWFKRLATVSFILFMAARFYIAADFIPMIGHTKSAFYKRTATLNEIKEMSHGLQVASFSNFAFPGVYEFYEGDEVLHLASPSYRYCQFDLTQDQHRFDGDTLFVIVPRHMAGDPSGLTRLPSNKLVGIRYIFNFQSLERLLLKPENTVKNGSLMTINIRLQNNCGKTIFFRHPSEPAICLMQDENELLAVPLEHFAEKLDNGKDLDITISIPKDKLDKEQPLSVYTRSKNGYRGEVISLKSF